MVIFWVNTRNATQEPKLVSHVFVSIESNMLSKLIFTKKYMIKIKISIDVDLFYDVLSENLGCQDLKDLYFIFILKYNILYYSKFKL